MTVEKIIGINQVVEQIDLCRSMVYLLMNPESKYYCEAFPKPVRIGKRRIGWVLSEVNQWVLNRIEQRDAAKSN